jgi:REP element-mobilizing transposase RayT
MEEKFKNKYRTDSSRLQNWDYRWMGAYFITICTKNREHYFGKIEDGKMVLSNAGVLANVFWQEIKNHAKNIKLGEFVVMPNHIHGILILTEYYRDGNNGNDGNNVNNRLNVETRHALSLHSTGHPTIQPTIQPTGQPTGHPTIQPNGQPTIHPTGQPTVHPTIQPTTTQQSIQHQQLIESDRQDSPIKQTIGQRRFQNQGKNSVSSIIGGYKSVVTKYANRLGLDFGWQPRFYDSIILDDKSFETVSRYIINNPKNWDKDQFSLTDCENNKFLQQKKPLFGDFLCYLFGLTNLFNNNFL